MATKTKTPAVPKLTKSPPAEPGWYFVRWEGEWQVTLYQPGDVWVAVLCYYDGLSAEWKTVRLTECKYWYGPLSPPKPIRRPAKAGR